MFLANGSMRKARLSVSRKSSYAAELQAELAVFLVYHFYVKVAANYWLFGRCFLGNEPFRVSREIGSVANNKVFKQKSEFWRACIPTMSDIFPVLTLVMSSVVILTNVIV